MPSTDAKPERFHHAGTRGVRFAMPPTVRPSVVDRAVPDVAIGTTLRACFDGRSAPNSRGGLGQIRPSRAFRRRASILTGVVLSAPAEPSETSPRGNRGPTRVTAQLHSLITP